MSHRRLTAQRLSTNYAKDGRLTKVPGVKARSPRTCQNSSQRWQATCKRVCTIARLRQQSRRILAPLGCAATISKQEEYNRTMQREMNWDKVDPYQYHPERGLYYHEIAPHIICGSQPRTAYDIDLISDKIGATDIVNLQQDQDLAYWGVNLDELRRQACNVDLTYRRCPTQDFDPHSLRLVLPTAVSHIHSVLRSGGKAYVHCTAGLGRAPAACIAYLYWFTGMDLPEATQHLTDIRPCGPKTDAIRGATYDLLDEREFDTFQHLPPESYAYLSCEQRQSAQSKVAAIVDS